MNGTDAFAVPAGPIVVYHLGTFVTSFAPIGREDLADFAGTERFELDEARTAELRTILAGLTLTARADASVDARWELRFGADDATSAWWLDRTGTVVATAERAATLEDTTLVTWLRGAFGPDDVVVTVADAIPPGPMPEPPPV